MLNTHTDIITTFVADDGRTYNNFRFPYLCNALHYPHSLSLPNNITNNKNDLYHLCFCLRWSVTFVCRPFYCRVNTKQKLSHKKDVGETVYINNIIISSFGVKQRKIRGAASRKNNAVILCLPLARDSVKSVLKILFNYSFWGAKCSWAIQDYNCQLKLKLTANSNFQRYDKFKSKITLFFNV